MANSKYSYGIHLELTFVISGSGGGGRGRDGAIGGSASAVFSRRSTERCYVVQPRGGHGTEVGGDSVTEREAHAQRRSEGKKRRI